MAVRQAWINQSKSKSNQVSQGKREPVFNIEEGRERETEIDRDGETEIDGSTERSGERETEIDGDRQRETEIDGDRQRRDTDRQR